MSLDLFAYPPDPQTNLLPYEGIVNDYGVILSQHEADACLKALLNDIAWRHDQALIYGKLITTARQVAWYGEGAFSYTYSGITRRALAWTPLLLQLKQQVERHLQAVSPTVFNSCLLNRYANGNEGMAWHSDDEKELGRRTVIASLSFGAERKFALRHKKTREKREIMLQHGQLIVMRGDTQQYWQHAIMKSSRVTEERISLTFRTYGGQNAVSG
ncbi:MAG: alpha-ketoglutarate-dependent dioxygenase AlkB [Neisseria sp.]|uniref:alpha-ketoglutarate-dependent dioxygenase AlkB family protein n=1 Tax=Neisseria sp. TaxID=192066 RepID=UPI0026DD684C|nr:alpha-ketoglutarate-dependent dioxygenase AlkB [Neisseria sp.]MDO4248854.1 alpha-ketoglutarate-dependent dioxygenase AlkB [Neisseria sp.]